MVGGEIEAWIWLGDSSGILGGGLVALPRVVAVEVDSSGWILHTFYR